MPSIGARAFGAQLEQRVSGDVNQRSRSLMVESFSFASTSAEGSTVRLDAISIGSGLGAVGSGGWGPMP